MAAARPQARPRAAAWGAEGRALAACATSEWAPGWRDTEGCLTILWRNRFLLPKRRKPDYRCPARW
eukprot:13224003-Alexandrium_andersonii.AAC.1